MDLMGCSLQAKLLDALKDDKTVDTDLMMPLGRFQNALDNALSSLVVQGGEQQLSALLTMVNNILTGADHSDEQSMRDLCEQLRLRAVSLPEGTLGRKQWPLVATFAENFHQSGSSGNDTVQI